MLTVKDAFAKFKSRLELKYKEQQDASRRHYEVRDCVKQSFKLERDFLTGSYARWTKTKPLKDVDIFCVLDKEKEGHWLNRPSKDVLEAFRVKLAAKYGEDKVSTGRRSIRVVFGGNGDEEEERVMSTDVVPAFSESYGYRIPDPAITAGWAKTDPEIHAERATAANKEFSKEWKPLVKMLKKWNANHGKPIKPSFLIEVMALDILYPPFSGGYIYELKSFFATAAERIHETWEDPAGLGPPVSDQMDATRRAEAIAKLRDAGKHVDLAIQLEKQGKTGEALRVWRDKVFGTFFPLS